MATMQQIIEQEILAGMVGRRITCPVTGKVMDVRSAVTFEFTAPGKDKVNVTMSTDGWEETRELWEARGIVENLIDGRTFR